MPQLWGQRRHRRGCVYPGLSLEYPDSAPSAVTAKLWARACRSRELGVELYGREKGYSRGRGGTDHLSAWRFDGLCSGAHALPRQKHDIYFVPEHDHGTSANRPYSRVLVGGSLPALRWKQHLFLREWQRFLHSDFGIMAQSDVSPDDWFGQTDRLPAGQQLARHVLASGRRVVCPRPFARLPIGGCFRELPHLRRAAHWARRDGGGSHQAVGIYVCTMITTSAAGMTGAIAVRS